MPTWGKQNQAELRVAGDSSFVMYMYLAQKSYCLTTLVEMVAKCLIFCFDLNETFGDYFHTL